MIQEFGVFQFEPEFYWGWDWLPGAEQANKKQKMLNHAGDTYEGVVGVSLEGRNLLWERLFHPKRNSTR